MTDINTAASMMNRMRQHDVETLAVGAIRKHYRMLQVITAIRVISNEEAGDHGPVDTRVDRIRQALAGVK